MIRPYPFVHNVSTRIDQERGNALRIIPEYRTIDQRWNEVDLLALLAASLALSTIGIRSLQGLSDSKTMFNGLKYKHEA